MTKFASYTDRVRHGGDNVIWGLGDSPEAAIEEALKNTAEDNTTAAYFETRPATTGLVAYLDEQGGDPKHFRIVGSVVDVLDGLTIALIDAAKVAKDELEGAPTVLYVQLSDTTGWSVHFADTEDAEMDLTRWDSGVAVVRLFEAIIAGNRDAASAYAVDVYAGWDSEWTVD